MLRDAITVAGREAPLRDSLRELGRGVHVLPDADGTPRPVVVNGLTPLWHDGAGWCETELPVCSFGLVHHPRSEAAARWYPDLTADALAAPPRHSFADCLAMLGAALAAGWRWSESHAPTLLALYTVYGIAAFAWRRRVYLHVCGPSSTGKSQLFTAWFGHFWPHLAPVADASEFALAADLGTAAVPLVIDEFEGDTRHHREILAAARRSTYGDAEKVRGTRSGEVRRTRFSWPLVIGSIAPLTTSEADANRFLVVNTALAPGHRTEEALPAFWHEQGVDPSELRDDLWRHALQNVGEMVAAAGRLPDLAPAPSGTDHRLVEAAHVLLAVAEVAETGTAAALMTHLGPAIADQAAAARRLSPQDRLVNALLYRAWRGPERGDVNAARIIGAYEEAAERGEEARIDEFAVNGFVVEPPTAGLDPPMTGPELWVALATVGTGALSGTPFAGQTAEELAPLLARHPARRGCTAPLRRGGVRARWQRLDIATLNAAEDGEGAADA